MAMAMRQELGDFSSVVCFKAVITGMEDALGEKATAIALISAGRLRGKNLAESLKLADAGLSLDDIAMKLNHALGKEGTRLCLVDKIETSGDLYKVYTRETICSAGEDPGSARQCTFTLGAIQGVLEVVTGKRLRGKHTESVLRGGTHDVMEFSVLQ
ncbi:MAG: hydrocarbon-binding protein [Cyanobacteriota bacterium]|nr:hydrocarbon-binding protein [Cyanobacteriota bacterium]